MAHTTHGILEAMEEYAKQEAIEFVKWKDKLRIDEKITVHPPEGSNLPTGVYIMTNAQLYKAWKDEDNQ